jgi:hypothetical protein
MFDNPRTLAFFDPNQNSLFTADCFGAPFTMPEAALADDVAAIPDRELEPAQLLWESVDSHGPTSGRGPVRRPAATSAGSATQLAARRIHPCGITARRTRRFLI